MNLYDGEIHEQGEKSYYRKLKFKKHALLMNSEQFSIKKITDEYRSDRELSIPELKARSDSLKKVFAEHVQIMKTLALPFFYGDSVGRAAPAMNTGIVARKYGLPVCRAKFSNKSTQLKLHLPPWHI